EQYWEQVVELNDLFDQWTDSLIETELRPISDRTNWDLGPVPPPGSGPRGNCGPVGWVFAQFSDGCNLTIRNSLAEGAMVVVAGVGTVGCVKVTVETAGAATTLCVAGATSAAGAVHD